MATKIIHKKSSTASSVPVGGDLEPGELAVNLADKKMYSKTVGGTVIELGNNPMSGAAIKTAYESEANAYTDTKNTKLGTVEDSATADQSDVEIEAAYAVINDQVSAGEITAGTEGTLRTYAPDDIKAFIDQHGGSSDATYEAPVANLAALSALAESGLIDRERRFVDAEIIDYFYDSTVGDGDIAPDDQTGGTGFWMKASSGATSTAKAYHTANSSITSSDTVVSLGGESFDTDAYHDNSVNNSRHEITVSDYYMVFGQCAYSGSVQHIFSVALIKKNGTTVIAKVQWTRSNATGTAMYLQVATGIIWLNAGDYVEMFTAISPTTSLNGTEDATWMSIIRMSNLGGSGSMTDAEVKTAYENNADTNEYDDAEQTKLAGIEALADVTDTTNVTAAGAAMLGGAGITVGGAHFNPQTGSTYTLLAADNGKTVTFTNAVVVTVPSGLGQGFRCTLLQLGSGQVSVVASSTTVNSLSGFVKCAGQYGVLGLLASGTNVFVLAGDLVA